MQSKYEVLCIVGEGAYGIVYKCRNKENNQFVAIKKFKETEDEIVKKSMLRELKVLRLLNHENIVHFKEAFKRKNNLYLVFEFVERNLLELLQETPKGLDPAVIKKIIYQLCKSIKYMHDQGYIHRDIKPENLLIDKELTLKLCDFGFTRISPRKGEQITDYVATRWYRSPELLLNNGFYGIELDYWSVGCIMGELVDGDPLFPGENEVDQINCIMKIIGRLTDEQLGVIKGNSNFFKVKIPDPTKVETLERRYAGKLSKAGLSFLKLLLHPDPKERLKGDAVFNHPYFENYSLNLNSQMIKERSQESNRFNEPEPKNLGLNKGTFGTEEKTTKISKVPLLNSTNVLNLSKGKNNMMMTSINFDNKVKEFNFNGGAYVDPNFKTLYKGSQFNIEPDIIKKNSIKGSFKYEDEDFKMKSKSQPKQKIGILTQNFNKMKINEITRDKRITVHEKLKNFKNENDGMFKFQANHQMKNTHFNLPNLPNIGIKTYKSK